MSAEFLPPQIASANDGPTRNPRPRSRKPRTNQANVTEASDGQGVSGPSRESRQRSWRDRKPRVNHAQTADGTSDNAQPANAQSNPAGTTKSSTVTATGEAARKPPRNNRPPKESRTQGEHNIDHNSTSSLKDPSKDPAKRFRRAPRFNAGLSEDAPKSSTDIRDSKRRGGAKREYAQPKRDDLTSTLTFDLSTPPYPDCLICFSAIRPQEPTFSCSPSIPIEATATASDDEGQTNTASVTAQCCWTTFHLKCIKAWAAKSVKEMEDAWKARGEERQGVWRCPGCQSKRSIVPTVYRYVLELVIGLSTGYLNHESAVSAVLCQTLDLLVYQRLTPAHLPAPALAHVRTYVHSHAILAHAHYAKSQHRCRVFVVRRRWYSSAAIWRRIEPPPSHVD